MKNSLFIWAPCLPHHSHPAHWNRTKVLVCWSLGWRPTPEQEHFTPVPHLFGTTYRCLSVQPLQLLPSRNMWRHISLPFLCRHQHTHHPLMLQSCFIDFAVEHQFGCRNSEPGFAGDIGAIEIWLIDWHRNYTNGQNRCLYCIGLKSPFGMTASTKRNKLVHGSLLFNDHALRGINSHNQLISAIEHRLIASMIFV